MESLATAPCPHCGTPNCVSNLTCHACARHLCDSNAFSPDAPDKFWVWQKAPDGATDAVLEKHRRNFRVFQAWVGQEDRLLLGVGCSVYMLFSLLSFFILPILILLIIWSLI